MFDCIKVFENEFLSRKKIVIVVFLSKGVVLRTTRRLKLAIKGGKNREKYKFCRN